MMNFLEILSFLKCTSNAYGFLPSSVVNSPVTFPKPNILCSITLPIFNLSEDASTKVVE